MAQDGLQSLHLSLDHPAPKRLRRTAFITGAPLAPLRVSSQSGAGRMCGTFSCHVFPCRSSCSFFPCFSPGSSQVHVGYVADCCWMLQDFAGKCRHKTECPQPGGVSPSAAARGAKQRNDPMAPMAMKIQGRRKESKRYGKSMETIEMSIISRSSEHVRTSEQQIPREVPIWHLFVYQRKDRQVAVSSHVAGNEATKTTLGYTFCPSQWQ